MCLQLATDPKRHPSLQSLSLISSGFKEPNPLLFSLVCDLFYVWWLFDWSCFSCLCFSAAHNKYTTPTIIRYIVNCSSSFPSSYYELAMKQIVTSQTILIIRLLPTKRQKKRMLIMFNTKEKMSTNGHDIVQSIWFEAGNLPTVGSTQLPPRLWTIMPHSNSVCHCLLEHQSWIRLFQYNFLFMKAWNWCNQVYVQS